MRKGNTDLELELEGSYKAPPVRISAWEGKQVALEEKNAAI